MIRPRLSASHHYRQGASDAIVRPISSIIPRMGRPVASTRETPHCEFFRLVIFRGSEFFDSPRSAYLYVNIFYFHVLLLSYEPTVVVFGYELHSHQFREVLHLLYLQNTSPCLFVGLD